MRTPTPLIKKIGYYSRFSKPCWGERYPEHPDDRLETIDGAAIAEVRGLRATQEDTVDADSSCARLLAERTPEDRKAILEKVFAKLEVEHGQFNFIGSTALVTSAWEEKKDSNRVLHTVTANLGDSTCYAVILDQNNKLIQIEQLNKTHRPEVERERIIQEGGTVSKEKNGTYRLNNDLAMSRAFGDQYHKNKGLSAIPEITERSFNIPDNGKAFILSACDGLTERNVLTTAEIGECISSLVKKGNEEVVLSLVNRAFNPASLFALGSTDNITAVFSPLPISIALFDGHGGNIVAKRLAKYFYHELKTELIPGLLAEIKPEKIDPLVTTTIQRCKKHCDEYLKHLRAVIVNELKNYPGFKEEEFFKQFPRMYSVRKNKISDVLDALEKNRNNVDPKYQYLKNDLLYIAMRKYLVVKHMIPLFTAKKSNCTREERLFYFHYLINKDSQIREVLYERRDNWCTAFLKAISLALSVFFSWHYLYGEKSTQGGLFRMKANQEIKELHRTRLGFYK